MNKVVEPGVQAPSNGRRARTAVRVLLVVVAVGVAALARSPREASEAKAAPAPSLVPVVAGPASSRDLPIWLTGVGSVLPLNVVNVKVRVDGPGAAPGQPPPDGGVSHPLLETMVWLFVRSTVTVVVVPFACASVYTAAFPDTLIVKLLRFPWT